MPYKRRYRKRRSTAASTIQSAWRRKMRKKRGGVVQRTALANRRAIKLLKKAPEIKYTKAIPATSATNYCGTVLTNLMVDNYGLNQSTSLWNSSSAGGYLPNAPDYQPVALCPCWVPQGASALGERTGDDIKMKNLIIKTTVMGGDCTANGGRFANVPVLQKMRCMVVLDKQPAVANTTLPSYPAASTWQFQAMGFQFFPFSSTWNSLLPAGTSIQQNKNLTDTLYGIPLPTANPPGLATNASGLAQRDLVAQAFRDIDVLDSKRFKVLKVKDVYVSQLPAETNEIRPFKCTKEHTIVIKHPYKFHFNSSKDVISSNQRIYVLYFSDTPTQRGSPASPVTDFVQPPRVQAVCRMNYTDQ